MSKLTQGSLIVIGVAITLLSFYGLVYRKETSSQIDTKTWVTHVVQETYNSMLSCSNHTVGKVTTMECHNVYFFSITGHVVNAGDYKTPEIYPDHTFVDTCGSNLFVGCVKVTYYVRYFLAGEEFNCEYSDRKFWDSFPLEAYITFGKYFWGDADCSSLQLLENRK